MTNPPEILVFKYNKMTQKLLRNAKKENTSKPKRLEKLNNQAYTKKKIPD